MQNFYVVSRQNGHGFQCPTVDLECPTCGEFRNLQHTVQALQDQYLREIKHLRQRVSEKSKYVVKSFPDQSTLPPHINLLWQCIYIFTSIYISIIVVHSIFIQSYTLYLILYTSPFLIGSFPSKVFTRCFRKTRTKKMWFQSCYYVNWSHWKKKRNFRLFVLKDLRGNSLLEIKRILIKFHLPRGKSLLQSWGTTFLPD